jgi:GTPase Era involved in 16S rRNA processing
MIEQVLDRKIYLELRVKVLPNWRNDPAALQRFGFSQAEGNGVKNGKGD